MRRFLLLVPLLVALLVGPAAVGRGGPTALAQGGTPSAEDGAPGTPAPAVAAEETLLEVTLPADALPRGAGVVAGLAHFTVPPGTRSAWLGSRPPACCPGPLVEYVLAGSYTVRAEAAIRVVRADGTAAEAPAGATVVLGAGDGLVSRNETAVEAANAGAAPVELLGWALIDDPTASFGGHYLGGWSVHAVDVRSGEEGPFGVRVPTGAAAVRLQRIELAPGAAVPPPPAGTRFAVTLPENAAGTPVAASLAKRSDGTFVNAGGEILTLYALTLEPTDAGPGTPGAATPTP